MVAEKNKIRHKHDWHTNSRTQEVATLFFDDRHNTYNETKKSVVFGFEMKQIIMNGAHF